MIYSIPYKTNRFFLILIKISIITGTFYFIYKKLANNPELQFIDFINFLSKIDFFSPKNILFLSFLSFINWFLEILKWQNLVLTIKKISFKTAIEQSLGSLSASLFTPNRIGEYGIKALYYPNNYRKRILFLNLLSNVFQMFITTVLGIIGIYFFIQNYTLNLNYYKIYKIAFISFWGFFFIGLYLYKSKITIQGISFKKVKAFVFNLSKKTLLITLFFSLLRYITFSFQFYFLLKIFNVEITYFNAMCIITSMYLIASILPSIFLFDVVIKGSVAIYLFSFLNINHLTISCIITLMWLFNFVIPSLLGNYYVFNFKFPKNNC